MIAQKNPNELFGQLNNIAKYKKDKYNVLFLSLKKEQKTQPCAGIGWLCRGQSKIKSG